MQAPTRDIGRVLADAEAAATPHDSDTSASPSAKSPPRGATPSPVAHAAAAAAAASKGASDPVLLDKTSHGERNQATSKSTREPSR